jgi:DNA mismatch repair protein MutS
MMKQYYRVKEKHRDAIVFFRMGDFYEMFNEDAVTASKVLGLTLTQRNHGRSGSIPLAGLPHHAVDTYLNRLIKAGYKVVICEQVEDPKKAKGIVKRDVVEVVTPGTIVNESLLEAERDNYLAAIQPGEKINGLAVLDLSTGRFLTACLETEALQEELERLAPAELLFPEDVDAQEVAGGYLSEHAGTAVSETPGYWFNLDAARDVLMDHFGTITLEGFGLDDLPRAVQAAGAIVQYVRENLKSALAHITGISTYNLSDHMLLDPDSVRNLEIFRTVREGDRSATLFGVLNRTGTGMGARELRRWLERPLLDKAGIDERLDAVEALASDSRLRDGMIESIRKLPDLERLLGRLGVGKAGARDLVGLKYVLNRLPQIREHLAGREEVFLSAAAAELVDFSDLAGKIGTALVDDPPLALKEGGIIRDGYSDELDELRSVSRGGKEWIAEMETRERARTGIGSLKVRYNRVFGYFIEVTKANLENVPEDYQRKQTLVNAERFVTPELKEYESKVLGAEERIAELEYNLFLELREGVQAETGRLLGLSAALARLDAILSLARVAVDNDYRRPTVSDGSEIKIIGGRHPVMEAFLEPGAFVPNDTELNMETHQILIITGPNMAGKSTYLRQIAQIAVLAQIGSFVPAEEAEIGLVDRIFTRVGASDSLIRGQSTFLVEMNETANLLHNATPRSLLILDEIGRGTSTFDGLSIAWSVAEYIHNNPRISAKTVFATHYHELTDLARILPRVKNLNVAVREWGEKIVFLRKIVRGGSDRSYGIHVAQLAGLPAEVIARAKEVLANLEADELTPTSTPRIARGKLAPRPETRDQLDLFAPVYRDHPILDEIMELDLDGLKPIEALNLLAALRRRLFEEKEGKG